MVKFEGKCYVFDVNGTALNLDEEKMGAIVMGTGHDETVTKALLVRILKMALTEDEKLSDKDAGDLIAWFEAKHAANRAESNGEGVHDAKRSH